MVPAISRRRMDMSVDKVINAVNCLDLKTLPLESVEILQRMCPTEQEVRSSICLFFFFTFLSLLVQLFSIVFLFLFHVQSKAYREYILEKKDINLLTEEDKFLLQLSRVERLTTKLTIMCYVGNFFDNVHLITPVGDKQRPCDSFDFLFSSHFNLSYELICDFTFCSYLSSASPCHYICCKYGEKLSKTATHPGGHTCLRKLFK